MSLAFASSGCVLWAFHERNKAMDRMKQQDAATRVDFDRCQAKVAEDVRVPDSLPAVPLVGTWQCLYTAPTGDQFSESLTFSSNGRSVAVTGRDNYGNNVIADGQAGGREVAFQHIKTSVVHLALDGTGRMLDGRTTYWFVDGNVCHETRYRCRRRY